MFDLAQKDAEDKNLGICSTVCIEFSYLWSWMMFDAYSPVKLENMQTVW